MAQPFIVNYIQVQVQWWMQVCIHMYCLSSCQIQGVLRRPDIKKHVSSMMKCHAKDLARKALAEYQNEVIVIKFRGIQAQPVSFPSNIVVLSWTKKLLWKPVGGVVRLAFSKGNIMMVTWTAHFRSLCLLQVKITRSQMNATWSRRI